jgi:uncharacterized protein (TIGR03382 family)
MKQTNLIVLVPLCLAGTALATVSPYAYITGEAGNPWGLSDPEDGMARCFGEFDQYAFENVNPATLFSDQRRFVYLEGGDHESDAMETFLGANSGLINDWVTSGGRLLINAAPNVGDGMNVGFGVYLACQELSLTSTAADPGHPVYNGPFSPVGTEIGGNYFSMAYIVGGGMSPITINSWGSAVVAEKDVGQGHIVVGGISLPYWFFQQPDGYNYYDNIIDYSASVPAPGVGAVMVLGLAGIGRRRRATPPAPPRGPSVP